jgi:diacylglycerol kinase family enzyme
LPRTDRRATWISASSTAGPFINLLTGGFGSRITVETDPELKRRLGGLAYVLTGLARLKDLTASRGRFRAENFEWEGPFLAIAIGNGRQAGGGMLDLMILPDLAAAQHDDVLGQLLRDGAMGIGALQHTTRSAWIEYESDEELHINLDGEPMRSRKFRVECRPGAQSVRLGGSPLLGAGA